jgi:hypothetical protein
VLIKLLAEERNCWIAGCCFTLWFGVHRYRSLLKKFYKLQDEKNTGRFGTAAFPAPQMVNVPVGVEAAKVETTTTIEAKKAQ